MTGKIIFIGLVVWYLYDLVRICRDFDRITKQYMLESGGDDLHNYPTWILNIVILIAPFIVMIVDVMDLLKKIFIKEDNE